MQTQRVVRRLFTALVAVVMGGTTAFAQNIPFDITDPTPRDVLIDVEAYNTISVVDGVVGNGGGASFSEGSTESLFVRGFRGGGGGGRDVSSFPRHDFSWAARAGGCEKVRPHPFRHVADHSCNSSVDVGGGAGRCANNTCAGGLLPVNSR